MPEIDISAYSDVRAEILYDSGTFRFPLDRYMMTPDDLDRLDLAYIAQVRKCMADKGYVLWHHGYPASSFFGAGDEDRRYGNWNLANASLYGYGLPDSSLELRREVDEAAEMAYASMTPAEEEAERSCYDAVAYLPVIIRGSGYSLDDDRSLYLPVELDGQAYFLALEDPGAEEAFAAWAACLEENGLRRGEGPEQLGPADIPEELEAQIRVAVVDVTCKQETGFIERLSSLEAQYQAALIDQNRAALDASVQKQAELLRQADEIIATHG